jgi:hypothetical protein
MNGKDFMYLVLLPLTVLSIKSGDHGCDCIFT